MLLNTLNYKVLRHYFNQKFAIKSIDKPKEN